MRAGKLKMRRGGVPGDRGVSFFSPEGRNLLTTLRAVVLPAAVVALCEADAASADAARQCHSHACAAVIVCT